MDAMDHDPEPATTTVAPPRVSGWLTIAGLLVQGLLGLFTVFYVWTVSRAYVDYDLAGQEVYFQADGSELPTWFVDLGHVIDITAVLAFLSTAIVFLVWFTRAHSTAASLPGRVPAVSRGMVVGAFFIPFYNLYGPYKAAVDIWRMSDPDQEGAPARSYPFVTVWWVAYIARGFADRALMSTENIEMTSLVVVTALEVVSVALAVLFVRRTTLRLFAGTSSAPTSF